MQSRNPVPEPWHAFFSELDSALTIEVRLQCIGGFVITVCYGLQRQTADVDFISVQPADQFAHASDLGREGSALHKKHGVYLQCVGSATSLPLNYEERLTEIFPGLYKKIRLFALDPYDLALSKLGRNIERDRSDVKHLVRTVPLDRETLKQRFEEEVRPVFIGNVNEADLTMKLWLEAFYEAGG